MLGSDSVRSATICCIPRRTKPTGCSCTPAGDWRHNHSDLAFVCRAQGIDEIVLNQELWFSSVSRLKLHLCEQNHPWDQWDGQHLHRCYPGEAGSTLWYNLWPDVTRTPPCPGQMITPVPGVATERLCSSSQTPRRRRRTWGSTMSAPTQTAVTAGQNEQLSLSSSSPRHRSYSVVKDQYLIKRNIHVCLESLYIPSSRHVWIFVSLMLSWLRSDCREDIQWLLTELTE